MLHESILTNEQRYNLNAELTFGTICHFVVVVVVVVCFCFIPILFMFNAVVYILEVVYFFLGSSVKDSGRDLYDRCTANTILNDEKLKAFPLR